jgi:subtilisin family serine protease
VEQPPALETALARLADSSHPGPETVSVTVMFTCPVADLEAAGFVAWTVIPSPDDRPSIAAGPIPTSRLRELAAVPGVRYVEGSQPHHRELNVSVPEIGADTLHDRNPGSKGAGVVVAVIDSGIDIDHRSFRNDDGTTRIVGIWDQTLIPTGPLEAPPAMFVRPPPAPPPPGVEYTRADIDATLQNRENGTPFPPPTAGPPRSAIAVRTVDTDGHGTHVAGIAAGDGSQSGNCRGSGVFVGVAPAADILIVKRSTDNPRIGESTNLLNALDWVWSHPAVVGNPTATPPVPPRPVVVNMSFGDNCGPHDGTSPVESGLDLFLLTHRGHAAVKSAGNEGATSRHAKFGVPARGFVDVTFRVNPREFSDCRLELWYQRNESLSMTLRGPVPPGGGARPTIATVGANDVATPFPADPATPVARRTTVTITTRTQDPRNSNGLIEMDFSSPAGVPLFAGEYEIHLENAFDSFVIVDGYTDKNTPGLVFTSNVDRDSTITTPGNGKLTVTVGAYAPRRGVLFFKWNGDLTNFSSFGPTRDVRTKPDIAAPGAKVTSVKSGVAGLKHCCCDCCVWSYTDETKEGGEFSGTSMAAPHATGVVALMLEKDATLSSLDILKTLADTASEPEVDHGSLPDDKWGAGRLNALGAVDGVPGPSPIAGPTPLLGPTPGPPPVPVPLFGPTALLRPSDDGGPPGAWLLTTPAGQHWYALFSRHFSEVRGLINSNKRVALYWHRMDGPPLLRLLGSALAGVGVLTIADDPEELLAWRPKVGRFLDALEQFGSPGLAADVRSHRDLLLSLDLHDIVAMIAAPVAGPAA